ncbi:MAG: asparagine synthase (glutamine-hydrolyzing) [Candidatus Cloacimonetes bacterium]|nr:asparagine synthase (glutamine-hydrolyzing) [Candidatus Cloacimonadota bacterium]
MCGIAGYISLCGESDQQIELIVNSMLDRIQHRGPNQRGIYTHRNAAIGMNRLSIIDREVHQIPYRNQGRSKAFLVYNGEIYNHQDIRASLPESIVYQTRSDAETCLYSMLHSGPEGLQHLNGMYAFAYWDTDTRQIIIARDKTGEKPVYYFRNQQFIAFCSELKGLVGLVAFKEKQSLCYDSYEFCFGSETLLESVLMIEPGEYLQVSEDGDLKTVDYWKAWSTSVFMKDDESFIEKELTDLIVDSIELRTRNLAHSYACFTSGGVDSALIACIAKPNRLYYCHYDLGKAFDEMDYAKLIARKVGVDLTVIEPSKEDFERTRPYIAWHLDTPCTWTSFSIWMILENLHPEIKVIMSGEGADEMFGGYHRYHLLHHDEQIHKLQALEEYKFLINRYYGRPEERYARLINRCDNRYDKRTAEFVLSLVEKYFALSGDDVIHAMGLHDFYTTMQVLLQMSDRMCMAFSIENRSPYLDHRLVQFAYQMPSHYKIRDGKTKWILKRIAEKFVPVEIAQRIDKRGFSAPVNIWYGWDKAGQYNRSIYRDMVYGDWQNTLLKGKSPYQDPGLLALRRSVG